MSTSNRYISLGGGIDLVTPPAQMAPGACTIAVNYECPVSGGYRRIDGYVAEGPVVPGEGPVLGVVRFMGGTYAIRKDTGADMATLYRLDGTTWTTISAVHHGRHDFVEGNFYATESGRALYGVGGGRPFELNASGNFTALSNAPSGAMFVDVLSNHLVIGFPAGSLMHSGIGDPTNWDAATGGAGEIGTGQAVTGLIPGTGGVLHIGCRDSVKTLYGNSAQDFRLDVTVPNTGVRPYSLQSLAQQPYFVAERGINSLAASNQYGDFSLDHPGRPVEPMFTEDSMANRVVASGLSKSKAQYRVWFDNGTGLYISPTGTTLVEYPMQVSVAYSGEDDDGREVLLVGDTQGQVYRLDSGADSFAGTNIRAYLALAFTSLGNPSIRKRFRRAFWDVRSGTNATIAIQPDFDYGDRTAQPRPRRGFIDYQLSGGQWNVAKWDAFLWSVPTLSQRPIPVTGSGTSLNFTLYSDSISEAHEVLGYDIHFEQRRLRRG